MSECSWLATGIPASVVVGGQCGFRSFIAPLSAIDRVASRLGGDVCQDLMNANRSGLIVSAWVIAMPCEKPG